MRQRDDPVELYAALRNFAQFQRVPIGGVPDGSRVAAIVPPAGSAHVVVGEIRGDEALELVQAMTSGHGGCMSTVHATDPTDTLSRLETMALLRSVVLRLQSIDGLVHAARMRGVTHIAEVLGLDEHGADGSAGVFVRTPSSHEHSGFALRAASARRGRT